MKKHKEITDKLIAIVPVIISAMGGAMVVFSSYDDSSGGTLLGLGLIILSIYLIIKNTPK